MAINKQGLIESDRQIFRIATIIRNQIVALENKQPKADIFCRNIDAIDYNLRKLKEQNRLRIKAIDYKWLLATKRIECGEGAMQKWANKILDNANRINNCINETYNPETYIPSIKDLIEEIKIARNTFKSLYYRDMVLSIKTHKITLSDGDVEIELGDFKINFNLSVKFDSRLSNILVIEALNPNPAQENSSVTHPHVQDGSLCAGEDPNTGATGDSLIRQALQQGRIEDAFKLVLAVLDNYNDLSPYVHLNEWNGEVHSCDECGANDLTEDMLNSCEVCNCVLCENCCNSCNKCSRNICSECNLSCSKCGEVYCIKCLENNICDDCGETICEDCMESCIACGKDRCSECLNGCDSCDAKICNECIVECEECSTQMCGDCKMTCENCKKNLCSTCHEDDECSLFKEVKV